MRKINREKRIQLYQIGLWILVFAWILLIFSNSMVNGSASGQLSRKVTEWIQGGLHLGIPFEMLHHYVRKFAHFSEYAMLGFLVAGASVNYPLIKTSSKAKAVLFSVLPFYVVALMDEGLQFFVEARVNSMTDVLIDWAGMTCGLLFFALILTFFINLKKSIISMNKKGENR